jgi:hypothetical protein
MFVFIDALSVEGVARVDGIRLVFLDTVTGAEADMMSRLMGALEARLVGRDERRSPARDASLPVGWMRLRLMPEAVVSEAPEAPTVEPSVKAKFPRLW